MNDFRSYPVESLLIISFKGAQYPKDVILFAVFSYVRYGVSYRALEEIMYERGVPVDHTTRNRWVTRYSGAIAETARRRIQNFATKPVTNTWSAGRHVVHWGNIANMILLLRYKSAIFDLLKAI